MILVIKSCTKHSAIDSIDYNEMYYACTLLMQRTFD